MGTASETGWMEMPTGSFCPGDDADAAPEPGPAPHPMQLRAGRDRLALWRGKAAGSSLTVALCCQERGTKVYGFQSVEDNELDRVLWS